MKTRLFLLILWCLGRVPALGQGKTEPPAWQVASDVAKVCVGIRESVASELRVQMRARVLDDGALGGLLAAVAKATNCLGEAQIENKVAAAAHEIQALSAQANALLKAASNKPLARKLDNGKRERELSVQLARAEGLRAALTELWGVVAELRNWASVEQRIAPPPELSDALKSRLGELVSDWEENRPTVGTPPQETELFPLDASPAMLDVAKLLRARMSEPVVLAFIGVQRKPFDLVPGHVAYLRKTGASSVVILAMQRHDERLRGSQQASSR